MSCHCQVVPGAGRQIGAGLAVTGGALVADGAAGTAVDGEVDAGALGAGDDEAGDEEGGGPVAVVPGPAAVERADAIWWGWLPLRCSMAVPATAEPMAVTRQRAITPIARRVLVDIAPPSQLRLSVQGKGPSQGTGAPSLMPFSSDRRRSWTINPWELCERHPSAARSPSTTDALEHGRQEVIRCLMARPGHRLTRNAVPLTDRSAYRRISRNPVYGHSASGMRIDPSSCWWFSNSAMGTRDMAIAVPFTMWTCSRPPPARRNRMPKFRAW